MNDQSKNEQPGSAGTQPLQEMQRLKTNGDFEITPCSNSFNLKDSSQFTKLELTSEQRMQISALIQNIPSILATDSLAQAYRVTFPKGLPHTLVALKQGGFGSMILENGKFVGSASLYAMTTQAMLTGAFTAMSVVSGMYFLAQINRELRIISMKLDEILAFLYEDKHSGLMAEMSFIRYVYQNYASIMTHEHQRIAAITSLQEAKKVAMKNIEFYISDLKSKVSNKVKNYAELEAKIEKSLQIKEGLELSQQVYVMSSILEAYYAQNQDSEYLSEIEADMQTYMDKCDKRILGSFSVLKGHIDSCKETFRVKDKTTLNNSDIEKKVDDLIALLNDGGKQSMRKAVHSALYAPVERSEYYISGDGIVYIAK